MQKKTEKEGKTMRWVKQKTHSKKDLKLVISIIKLNINGLDKQRTIETDRTDYTSERKP